MKGSTIGDWIEELRRFPKEGDLRRSDFFKKEGPAISKFLSTPERQSYPGASPHLRKFLRAVTWNIERGTHLPGIAEALRVDPYLRVADLIFLNEVDVGMARTGNIHIASELAHALKMNWIFAPAHLELSGNDAADREIHGQNAVGIQGNAILSRYPLGEPRIIELPRGQSLLQTEQKRYGRRIALQATVYTDRGSFCAVCTHLEVFDTPAGRARQMNAILESLASDGEDKAVLLGGDWNTHSFARGTRWRTLHAYLRVLWANPEQLVYKLKHPDCDGEKLFASLKRGGYQWEEFNDDADTCGVTLSEEEHVQPWPRFLQGLVRRRLEQHQHQLRFRLDWFASCGLKALRKSEEVESALGISSVSPMTRAEVNDRPQPLSDHHPILVDIQLPPEEATQIRAVA